MTVASEELNWEGIELFERGFFFSVSWQFKYVIVWGYDKWNIFKLELHIIALSNFFIN